MTDTHTEPQRQKTLTEKGQSYYESRLEYHLNKIAKVGNDIDSFDQNKPTHTAEDVEHLRSIHSKYSELCGDLLNFLCQYNTQESMNEQSNLEALQKVYNQKVSDFEKSFKHTEKQPREKSSKSASKSSSSSRKSSASTILGRQRAKLDGARAKLKFAEKEAAMKREAALLSIEMERLQVEKEVVVANAEYMGMKDELYGEDEPVSVDEDNNSEIMNRYFDSMVPTSVSQPNTKLPQVTSHTADIIHATDETTPRPAIVMSTDTQPRMLTTTCAPLDPTATPVKQYISNLNISDPHAYQEVTSTAKHLTPSQQTLPLVTPSTSAQVTPNFSRTLPMYSSPPRCNTQPSAIYNNTCMPYYGMPLPISSPKPGLPEKDNTLNLSQDFPQRPTSDSAHLNPRAQTFVPTNVNGKLEPSVASEIGQFFLKKELLISRLNEFNDKPENYDAWKYTFMRLVSDLKLSPSDQLEMLGKWLGPTSKKYAESVRNSNMGNPDRGVRLLWERLDNCYGTPEEIEASLLRRLSVFEPITHNNPKRYYDLVDLLSEIESLQNNERYHAQLAVFNTSSGVTPIAKKVLPYSVYEKWITRASNYKLARGVVFPPFSEFVTFVKDMCRIRNDPSFTFQPPTSTPSLPKTRQQSQRTPTKNLSVKVTSVSEPDNMTLDTCPIHSTNHTLNECRTFRSKPIFVRRKFLKDNGICFGCCLSKDHVKANCPSRTDCKECKDKGHPTALHINFKPKDNGGEQKNSSSTIVKKPDANVTVSSKCTEVCGDSFRGKSCSKIVLVRVYHKDNPDHRLLTYAILDEQSNQSLAKSQLFTFLNIDGPEIEYTLSSCSGLSSSSGKIANDCVIEPFDGSVQIDLPPLIECDNIPENREEIPTPSVAASYSHLQNIEQYIPPLHDVPILLLIGRDLGIAHHVLDQRLCRDSNSLPYAQKLQLGWVIIGESCLGKVHKPSITANKTHLTARDRPTIFQPSESSITVKEKDIGANVFVKTVNDNKVGMSVEDREFLHIMKTAFEKSESGHWQAPLPFCSERQTLPNNRSYTLRRAINLHNSLQKDVKKREDMIAFIGKMFEREHAEAAPPLTLGEECWYLPVFGVYNPQKPGQVRAVFDSSAQYSGVSLNSVLLSGPDLNNSLLSVLLRFRKDAIAVTADIEQMFHSFMVKEEHRNFLRFFWYESNDPTKPLIEYRMKVHLFGNSPSPAVACYGLRKTADNSEEQYGSDVKSYIYNHFYVDDGLISLPSSAEIIDLIKRTQTALLQEGKLRLHKFASNSPDVMQAFPQEDLAKDLKDFDFKEDCLPTQRSLGLIWNLQNDSYTFRVTDTNKPYTRRGILSVINSLYDPLGIASPVVIAGKLFLRQIVANNANWDDPLPDDLEPVWNKWKTSLRHLASVSVPRRYTAEDVSFDSSTKDLLLFSDASEDAIAAVAYIRTRSSQETSTNFVIGKAKVAPSHGHSLPRLELCAAVLAVELYDIIVDTLDAEFNSISFHTDSRVVLGYINNRTRRFFMYVSNRVERIHQSSTPHQWSYIPSEHNPADCATRALSASCLQESPWLHGPTLSDTDPGTDFPLIDPTSDKELKPVTVTSTSVTMETSLRPIHERFSKFSDWTSLLRAVSCLLHVVSSFSGKDSNCRGWHFCTSTKLPESIRAAKVTVLRMVQKLSYPDEIESLQCGKSLPRNSPLRALDPYLDEDKLIRVGGRLSKSHLSLDEKFPIVLPKNHHISKLLIRYYHERVHHQGRHITQGALRSAGFWIIGEKKLISSAIHHCVTCKKLRGKVSVQKMSDLPVDRLTPSPPFSYVGVDVFGPWNIVYRRTRGSCVNSKRWAVLFTCLVVRAIHIEVIEEMSSSSFINALRRFISVRGPVKELRSDRGSNFIGAVDDLRVNVINVEDTTVSSYLNAEGVIWKFNPPHSSHMGGVWEKMIGVSRRILDSLLSGVSSSSLTHEVLVTFMCEVMAIVNSRPIVPVSSDPSNPCILSPSVLLTHKTGVDTSPFQDLDLRDMYKAQWKRVQCLADRFWKRWSSEFLQTLQKRTKWQDDQPNISDGDVVLMKQTDMHRNNWPLAVVEKAIRSDDGRVRKAEVRVMKDGTPKTYTRPISELVFLLSK